MEAELNELKTNILIKTFIKKFVQKNRRERSYFELSNKKRRAKFINRLSHNQNTIFEMKYLKQTNKKDDFETIKKQINIKSKETCYIISHNEDFDNKYFPFDEIIAEIYYYPMPSIIINEAVDSIFLVTEHEAGSSAKYIGRNI